MGRTWDALRRADRARSERPRGESERSPRDPFAGARDPIRWTEELASLEVSVHALEDRLELELGGLRDELRETLAKAHEQAGTGERAAREEFRAEAIAVRRTNDRVELRLRWLLIAVAGLALVVLLAR